MGRTKRWLAAVIWIVVGWALAVVPHARAQIGAGMDMGAMTAPVSSRSLDVYAKLLALDADQKEAAESLLVGYQAQHRAAVESFNKKMESLQKEMEETQDWMAFGTRMRDLGVKFRDDIDGVERAFMDDLKVLLSQTQLERFVRVERARRREKLLMFGLVAGQAVDLFAVAEAVKAADKPGVEDLLRSYEVEMDRRLQDFERWQREQEKAFEGVNPMNFDMDQMSKLMGQMYERARQIRDLNRRFARQIASSLGEGERFTEEFNRRAHPRVYRPSYTARCLAAAEGFADLSAEQRAELKLLRESYVREAAAANARWAAVVEAAEDKRGANMMEEMMQRAMGGGGNDEVADARKARQELDERMLDRLKAILTKAQAERLPEKPAEAPAPMGDMGDMFYMPEPDPDHP
jgi:hypothetical protein